MISNKCKKNKKIIERIPSGINRVEVYVDNSKVGETYTPTYTNVYKYVKISTEEGIHGHSLVVGQEHPTDGKRHL